MEAESREEESRRLSDERASEAERRAVEREEIEKERQRKLANDAFNSEMDYYLRLAREIVSNISRDLDGLSNNTFINLQDIYRKLNVFTIRKKDVETIQLIERLRESIAPRLMRQYDDNGKAWRGYMHRLRETIKQIISGLESKRRT